MTPRQKEEKQTKTDEAAKILIIFSAKLMFREPDGNPTVCTVKLDCVLLTGVHPISLYTVYGISPCLLH